MLVTLLLEIYREDPPKLPRQLFEVRILIVINPGIQTQVMPLKTQMSIINQCGKVLTEKPTKSKEQTSVNKNLFSVHSAPTTNNTFFANHIKPTWDPHALAHNFSTNFSDHPLYQFRSPSLPLAAPDVYRQGGTGVKSPL